MKHDEMCELSSGWGLNCECGSRAYARDPLPKSERSVYDADDDPFAVMDADRLYRTRASLMRAVEGFDRVSESARRYNEELQQFRGAQFTVTWIDEINEFQTGIVSGDGYAHASSGMAGPEPGVPPAAEPKPPRRGRTAPRKLSKIDRHPEQL